MAQAGTVWVDVRGDMSQFKKDVGDGAKAAGAAVSSSLGSGARTVVGDLGKVASVTGVAVAGIGAAALKTSSDFNESMSGVASVANASSAELEQLREAALKAGADTVFSATEAAQAQSELVKAGVSVADVMGGALAGSLDLAAAGQLDLANAATISAQAMNLFGLGGADVSHIADVLAAGANKSAADVGTLGDALRQGGLVAAQTGLTLEDTVGVLSLFADSALVGSDAGTSLKTMLQRLVPQSDEAAEAMKNLGLQFFDAQGAFVGIDEVAGQLQTALGGLSDEQRNAALTTLFGSDAVRAASILMEGGKAKVDEYTAAVNDMGAAQRMASTQTDNLKGDIEQLSGAVETSLIRLGDLGDVAGRQLVQSATAFVDVFNTFATTPAWEAISRNVAELSTGVGGGLTGLADDLQGVLNAVSPAEVDAVFGRLEGGFTTIREAARGLEGVIAGVGLSIGGLGAASVLGPLGGIVPTISPITGILGGLVLGSDAGRDALIGLGKQAAAFATGPGAGLLRSASDLADELSEGLASVLSDVGEAAFDAAAKLGPVLGDAMEDLGPPVADILEALGELAAGVLPELAELAGTVLPPAVEVLGAGLSVAADAVGLLAENTELLVPALAAFAAIKFSDQFRGIGDVVKGAAESVGTFRDAIGQIAATHNVSKLEALKGAAGATVKEVGGLAGGFIAANGPLIALTAAAAGAGYIFKEFAADAGRVAEVSKDLGEAIKSTREEFAAKNEEATRSAFADLEVLDVQNQLGRSLEDMSEFAAKYGDNLGTLAGRYSEASDGTRSFKDLISDLPKPVQELALQIQSLEEAGDIDYSQAIRYFTALGDLAAGTADRVKAAKEEFTSIAQEAADAGKISAEELKTVLAAISEAKTPDELNAAFTMLNNMLGITASAARTAADQMQRLIDLIDKLSNSERDADEASRRLAETRDRVSKAFAEGGAGIDANTEAGRRNADAIKAQVEASEKLAETQALLDPTGQQSTLTLHAQRQALQDLANQGLLTAEELQHLIEIYGLTDQDITATVSADTSAAETSLAEVQTEFDKVKANLEVPVQTEVQALIDQGKYAEAEARLAQLERDRVVAIKATVTTSAQSVIAATEKAINLDINGNGAIGRAAGGPVWPGQLFKVGEQGPELGYFPKAGQIIDAATTERLLGSDPKAVSGSEMSMSGVEQRIDRLTGEVRTLADALSVVATRPIPRPVVDVHASSDVRVTAETRARAARSGD